MRTRRVALASLAIGVIAISVLVTSPLWLPRDTSVDLTQAEYTVVSGSEVVLSAKVVAGASTVSGQDITWSTQEGTLNGTAGTSVIFTAPGVTTEEVVIITASFPGSGVYRPSSAQALVLVSPPMPSTTSLKLSPEIFEIHGGDSVFFNVTTIPSDVPASQIAWSLSPAGAGTLSSNTGSSVTFKAAVVQSNTTVSVTASFAGNALHSSAEDVARGDVLPPQVPLRTPTFLKTSPSSFVEQAGGSMTLTATLTDDHGNPIPGRTIMWSVTPSGQGSLSSATGTTVTYTAPVVNQNSTVTVAASFLGDDSFVGSSGSSTGTVYPSVSSGDLFIIRFDRADMTGFTAVGPVLAGGLKATNATSQLAKMSGVSISHLGVTAAQMTLKNATFYLASFSAFSLDSNSTVQIAGDSVVDFGSPSAYHFVNGTMMAVQISGTGANFTRFVSAGEYVGGSEPYVPTILGATIGWLTMPFNFAGPASYGLLTNGVSNITASRVDLTRFSFEHPATYSLNRTAVDYTSTNRWALNASTAVGFNMTAYPIFFKLFAHEGYLVRATGDQNITSLIPHVSRTQFTFYVSYISVHCDLFSADEFDLSGFLLSVE